MSKQFIEQIPVANCTREQYREIISMMKNEGYESLVRNDDIRGIVIDNVEKKIFEASITYLAAWCAFRRYPLNFDQFINNYHSLITEPDEELYQKLTGENPLGKQCGLYY